MYLRMKLYNTTDLDLGQMWTTNDKQKLGDGGGAEILLLTVEYGLNNLIICFPDDLCNYFENYLCIAIYIKIHVIEI